MIYDRTHDLRRALSTATSISKSRSDPQTYREKFRTEWIHAYLPAATVIPIPPVPDQPESLPGDSEWGYKKFLARATNNSFNTEKSENAANAAFLDVLSSVVGSSKGAGPLLKLGKSYFSLGAKPNSELLDASQVSEMYDVAIQLNQAAAEDPVLDAVTSELIHTTYGDKLTNLEIIGTPDRSSSSGNNLSTSALEAELEKRQQAAIERVRGLLDAERAARAPVAQGTALPPPPEEGPGSFQYEVREAEGLLSLFTTIVQFDDPPAARRLAMHGNAIIGGLKLFHDFDGGHIGTLALAGGFAGIVSDILSSQADDGAQAATFAQLQAIAESIESLRELIASSFGQVYSKLNTIIGFQIAEAGSTKQGLAQLKQLSEQLASSVQALSVADEQRSVSAALAVHRGNQEDALIRVRESCALLQRPVSIADNNRCIRAILVELLHNSRAVNQDAVRAAQVEDRAALLSPDPIRVVDALMASELSAGSSNFAERDVPIGSGIEHIELGLPDVGLWLALMTELRRQVEINGLTLSEANKDALAAVAVDGDNMELALRTIDESRVNGAWTDYMLALYELDTNVRRGLSENTIFTTTAGLPYDSSRFCPSCDYSKSFEERLASLSEPERRIPRYANARVNATAEPATAEPWATRKWLFDLTDHLYVSKLADAPSRITKIGIGVDNAMYVQYESLPKEFRDKLALSNIQYLDRAAAIRIYLRITNAEFARPNVVDVNARTGACGPVQPGDVCWVNGRISGNYELVALTSPIREPEQFVAEMKSPGGLDLSLDSVEKEWSKAFGARTEFLLYSGDLNVAAPMPLKPGPNKQTIVPVFPTWKDILAYVYQDLSQSPSVRPGPGLIVLSAALEEAQKHEVQMLSDIYQATQFPEGSHQVQSPHLVITDDRARDLKVSARKAQLSYRRWLFLAGMWSVPNWGLSIPEKCMVWPMSVLNIFDDRDRYFFDQTAPLIVVNPRSSWCSASVRDILEFPGREVRLIPTLQGWTSWAKQAAAR